MLVLRHLIQAVLLATCQSAGLKNSGNTCYANSALQLLHKSKDFRAALAAAATKTCNPRVRDLSDLFAKMDGTDTASTAKTTTFDPENIIPKQMLDGKEHDVEEFLDALREIKELEFGPIRNEIHLDISGPEDSIQDLVNSQAAKGHHSPSSLLINLKRSSPDKTKNAKPVRPALRLAFAGQTYKLVAFIEHQGRSSQHGHFLAFYQQPNGDWFEASDERITQVTEATGLEHAALGYIYLYERL